MVETVDLGNNALRVHSIKTGVTKNSDVGSAVLSQTQAVTNVGDTTPTLAELTTAFGAPATKGRGWIGTVDDNDGDTNFFIVAASDASYYFLKMTKAS